VDNEKKKTIVGTYKVHDGDTGSVEVQVALLTARINELTAHLKVNSHDFHSQRGLFKLIGHRRRLLAYLNKRKLKSYQTMIEKLGLRK
jgi:small subunit ribosomal protein S15